MPTLQTREEFIKKAIAIHGTKYKYDDIKYVNSSTEIDVYCNECKECFKTIPKAHISKAKRGCPKCNKKKQEERKLTTPQFVEKALKIHEGKCTYENTKYTGQRNYVLVTCAVDETHGDFKVRACKHIRGDCTGCPKCEEARFKKMIEEKKEKAKKKEGNKNAKVRVV